MANIEKLMSSVEDKPKAVTVLGRSRRRISYRQKAAPQNNEKVQNTVYKNIKVVSKTATGLQSQMIEITLQNGLTSLNIFRSETSLFDMRLLIT